MWQPVKSEYRMLFSSDVWNTSSVQDFRYPQLSPYRARSFLGLE